MARELGLPKTLPRGGSQVGRVLATSRTRVAGIRFVWSSGEKSALRVVATWVDRHGQHRHTSFSVDRNGVEGALDKAIAARTSAGAPAPDRAMLLKLLRKTHRAGNVRTQ